MSQNIINMPLGTSLGFRCSRWDITTEEQERQFWEENYKIFKEELFNGVEYYCIEQEKYTGDNYFMVKKQDLLPYLKEESYEIY